VTEGERCSPEVVAGGQEPFEGSCGNVRPAMLDQMRKNSRSLLITVLFVIIIAVFIINFGPQSRGSSCEQAMSEDHYAAKVGRQTISNNTFRYGFMMSGGDRFPPKMAKQ
jgi:hypothetical protein